MVIKTARYILLAGLIFGVSSSLHPRTVHNPQFFVIRGTMPLEEFARNQAIRFLWVSKYNQYNPHNPDANMAALQSDSPSTLGNVNAVVDKLMESLTNSWFHSNENMYTPDQATRLLLKVLKKHVLTSAANYAKNQHVTRDVKERIVRTVEKNFDAIQVASERRGLDSDENIGVYRDLVGDSLREEVEKKANSIY